MSWTTPHEQVARMITGYWVSQAVHVAAKLGIADLLADGPRDVDDLAKATGTHARSLYRLLRALASVGVFAEEDDGRFLLTPMAECLREDAPASQKAMAVMMGDEHYQCWGDLLASVRTGRNAFKALHGQPIFEYLAQNPEPARTFDAAMTAIHGRETAAMLDACKLSDVRVLADIGGGNGSTLAGILRRHHEMKGLLFDLPNVADRAREALATEGLADRSEVVGGSFFEAVPPGADAYLLRHILHDWDDAEATAILRSIHKAMGADGRLLVVESVIAPGNAPSFGKLLDLNMMLIPGGQERTADEYARLFEGAGFRLERIVPTAAEVGVIEGRKA